MGDGLEVTLLVVFLGWLLLGLKARCLSLLRIKRIIEEERGWGSLTWSQGKGFRVVGLFCNS